MRRVPTRFGDSAAVSGVTLPTNTSTVLELLRFNGGQAASPIAHGRAHIKPNNIPLFRTFSSSWGNEIDVQKTQTHELCIDDVCLTRDQLAAVLAGTGGSASSNSRGSSASPTYDDSSTPDTPPVISINSANPATIHVGDSYADLSATITGPQADLNLGIKTFLNGAIVSNIVLDTSAAETDTIDYVVTDANGLAAISTRTVIVEVQAQPVPPISDATTSAATTTDATTTAQWQRFESPLLRKRTAPRAVRRLETAAKDEESTVQRGFVAFVSARW